MLFGIVNKRGNFGKVGSMCLLYVNTKYANFASLFLRDLRGSKFDRNVDLHISYCCHLEPT